MKAFAVIILSMFLLIQVSCAEGIKPVAHWEISFDKKWATDSTSIIQLSKSADSWKLYQLAYPIDGLTSMYRATGKRVYLDHAIMIVNNIIASSKKSQVLQKSQYKDGYLGWANKSNSGNLLDGKEYPLYESYCWRYVTSMLTAMKSSGILTEVSYMDQFTSILAFTEAHIYQKWKSRGVNNIYRSNVHMSSHWARICLDLAQITNKKEYRHVFIRFLDDFRSLRNITSQNHGGYLWRQSWKHTGKIQDVSHGNAVIAAIIEFYESNIEFNRRDIDGMINLFRNKIWRQGSSSKYMDGSGIGNGWFTDGFVKLGRFDRSTQMLFEQHKVGRSLQFLGNMALNAKILKSKKN